MEFIDQLTENGPDGPAGSLALGQMEKLLDVTAKTYGIADGHPRKCPPHVPALVEIMWIAGKHVDK